MNERCGPSLQEPPTGGGHAVTVKTVNGNITVVEGPWQNADRAPVRDDGARDGFPRPTVTTNRGPERRGDRLERETGVGPTRFTRVGSWNLLGDGPRTAAQLGCGDGIAYPLTVPCS